MDYNKLTEDIVTWIKDYANDNKIKSLIVGVSGGIDSSVVARLCEATGLPTYCVSMPMEVNDTDPSLILAKKLCEGRSVNYSIVPIGNIHKTYLEASSLDGERVGASQMRQANIRSRIRANVLYDYAAKYNGIVVGTGNKDEDTIGYFTKGGDGLVDICPLSDIHKSGVYEIGKIKDVPQEIIDVAPTAGLWDGQTDEQELGMIYPEVEWAIKKLNRFSGLCNTEITSEIKSFSNREDFVIRNVSKRIKVNAHKLKYPPIFKFEENKYKTEI